jgi:hypothetical protein
MRKSNISAVLSRPTYYFSRVVDTGRKKLNSRALGNVWNLPKESFDVGFKFNSADSEFHESFLQEISPRGFFFSLTQISLLPCQSHRHTGIFPRDNMNDPADRGFN